MLLVVANDMASSRYAHESIDGPTVFPVNPAVGIAEETDVHIGIVDCKEAVYGVLEPDNPSVADTYRRVPKQVVPVPRLCVSAQVCVHDPSRIVLLNQIQVLEESPMVEVGRLAKQAERKGIHHAFSCRQETIKSFMSLCSEYGRRQW
jgi:hypothetical protein